MSTQENFSVDAFLSLAQPIPKARPQSPFISDFLIPQSFTPVMEQQQLPSIIVPSNASFKYSIEQRSGHNLSSFSSLLSSSTNDEFGALMTSYPSPPGYQISQTDWIESFHCAPATPTSPKRKESKTSTLRYASDESNKDDTKLHPCPHPGCTRMFTRLYNVRSHLICHSGDRPHPCVDCPASFRRKHDLQRHVRTSHSKSRPFQCTRCPRSFARRDHWRRHCAVEDVLEEKRGTAIREMGVIGLDFNTLY